MPETSPLRPPKPPRTEIRHYSWRNSTRKEVCMHIRTLKPLKARKNKREVKSRHLESTNYDVIIASSNSDVILRNVELNKPIARKRYVPRKRSLKPSEGSFKSSLRVYSRTFTFIALLLATVISVSGDLVNIRLSERKNTIGNSSNLFLSVPIFTNSFRGALFPYILRDLSAPILDIGGRLWPCMMTETIWNNNKRLKRRREVFHNTRIRDKGGYGHTGYSHRYPGCHGYGQLIMQSFARIFLAGKCLRMYLFLFTDLWASSVYYSDIYMVNLELDDNFKILYDLIYLYIYIYDVYRSWASCNWATYPADIFVEYIYFGLFSLKSHCFNNKKS